MDTRIISDAITEIAGEQYMRDTRGALVPVKMVKPIDKLMDELVRKMVGYATELSEQIGRFRGHCFDDVGSFQALIAQEYGASLGGAKGNVTFTTYDGTQQVKIQVSDLIEFGPELQAAKALVDECLNDWATGSRDELRAVVNRAFQVDKEGKINRAEIFMLLRVDIDDERWISAMLAVRESIRVIGSRTYIRFYRRPAPDADWQPISIDLARAGG